MISLQEFKALLSKVDESGRKLDEISEVLGGADKLCEAACTDEVIRLLEIILDDRDGDISYWVWELDFGRKWKPGCVTDSDGTDIKLETAEDLYRYLWLQWISIYGRSAPPRCVGRIGDFTEAAGRNKAKRTRILAMTD